MVYLYWTPHLVQKLKKKKKKKLRLDGTNVAKLNSN